MKITSFDPACLRTYRPGAPLRVWYSGHRADRRSAQNHSSDHADPPLVSPSFGEVEQMGIEQRTDDILDHDHQPDPRREPAGRKEPEVSHPHRNQQGGADKADLDRDRKQLIVRITWGLPGHAGLSDVRAAELLRNRTGAMAEHRRIGDEHDRSTPEFQPLAGARTNTGGLIIAGLLHHRGDALSQAGRSLPCSDRQHRYRKRGAGEPSPAESARTEQQEQDRNDD